MYKNDASLEVSAASPSRGTNPVPPRERLLWGILTQVVTGKKRVHDCPGQSNSSALIQGLADLESSVFRTWEESWQVSANLSRAFSQFRWVLVLVREASSTERAALAPKPDWDFLIFSWICEERRYRKKKIITQPKQQFNSATLPLKCTCFIASNLLFWFIQLKKVNFLTIYKVYLCPT